MVGKANKQIKSVLDVILDKNSSAGYVENNKPSFKHKDGYKLTSTSNSNNSDAECQFAPLEDGEGSACNGDVQAYVLTHTKGKDITEFPPDVFMCDTHHTKAAGKLNIKNVVKPRFAIIYNETHVDDRGEFVEGVISDVIDFKPKK